MVMTFEKDTQIMVLKTQDLLNLFENNYNILKIDSLKSTYKKISN